MGKTLSVSAIYNGTVIDHIQAGQALKIIKLLRLTDTENQITIGLNLPSNSLGLKDLIKLENKFFSEDEAKQITVFAPQASINIIENFSVVKKIKNTLPTSIHKVLDCPNINCVSRTEAMVSCFYVEQDGKRIMLTCRYCEKNMLVMRWWSNLSERVDSQ